MGFIITMAVIIDQNAMKFIIGSLENPLKINDEQYYLLKETLIANGYPV